MTQNSSLNASERIVESLLGFLEGMIDSLKNKPVRSILKLVVLSWFSYVAIAFIVFTGILLFYALYTSTDAYRFNQAKKFLVRKYGSAWPQHLEELQPYDYPISDGAVN